MGRPLTPIRAALLASTSLVAALASAEAQQVLPTRGKVASGAATISQSGAAMTVQQTTPRAILNWDSFSIGAGNSVTFAQPDAASATLNRVTGSTPSNIAGQLTGNGQVFIVNPNGVAITPTGVVNLGGGFVASTLGITDQNFNNGRLKFEGGGASAPVSNAGTITTAPGGFVGLLGGTVSNSGTITTPLGKVALGSGEQATLDLTGDGFLQVALPTNATAADGKALIDVSGKVSAAGGQIAIKAATAANAVRNAINLSGVATARSARKVGGSIVLGGGEGGDVAVSGKLDASGRKGGSLSVSGRNVALTNAKLIARGVSGTGGAVAVTAKGAVRLAGAWVDASGATGGGSIAIGGGPGGKGPLAHAANVDIATSVINADALTSGKGGTITVWSAGLTTVSGRLTARGGALSGDGGSVETSGEHAHLDGAQVNTSAPHGAFGSWLIDPQDFTIGPGGDMTAATLEANLAGGDVNIMSSTGSQSGTGQIFVNDIVSWSAPTTLTLDAASNILVNANINVQGTGGGVAFIYGDTLQSGVGSASGALRFAMTDAGPTASLTFAASGGSLSVNGAPYVLLRTEGDLGQLSNATPTAYALANDITLTTAHTTAVIPTFVGQLEGLGHKINNLSLTQGAASADVGFFGVVASVATVSNLFLANASVAGGSASGIGALAGQNQGLIYNSGSSGSVVGSGSNVGGLVGSNSGLVNYGFSSAAVTVTPPVSGFAFGAGGLVGTNSGGVVNSFASGDVTGNHRVGGLVGDNSGFVNSGAAGFVVGDSEVGGVVGQNSLPDGGPPDFAFGGVTYGPYGAIQGAYGFGGVSGTTNAGGIVGLNSGAVTLSYFNGPVSGGTSVGGVVGFNTSGAGVDNSYAIGPVTGVTNVGGLAGRNTGFIDSSFAMGTVRGTTNVGGFVGSEGQISSTSHVTNSYSTGAVYGTTGSVGGLIGFVAASSDDTISHTYWDLTNSGQSTSAGGTGAVGLTRAQLQGPFDATLPLGPNFSGGVAGAAGAAGGETNVYPYLNTLFANGVRAVSGIAYTDSAKTKLLVSLPSGPGQVYVDTEGSVKNPSNTGVDGYYYVFLDPTKLPTGADIVAYTTTPNIQTSLNINSVNAATYLASAGANNTSGVDVVGSTFNATTGLPTYSALTAARDNAISGDAIAAGVIASLYTNTAATFINLTSLSANFTVDTPITTTAKLTISGATTLGANVTATGGVLFLNAVALATTVTVDSGANDPYFAGPITGTTPGAGMTFNGPTTLGGSVTTINGALVFNGAVLIANNITISSGTAPTTFNSTVDNATFTYTGSPPPCLACNLTVTGGALTLVGAVGGVAPLGALSLTSGASLALPSITAGSILANAAGGDLTLNSGAILTASGSGTAVTLAASGAFINNSGAGAIVLTGSATPTPPNWLIYSANPTADTFGGLDSGNFAIWNTPYPASTPPGGGNFYLFAFQPTVTFTSINDAKTYGQDVTARVATDYMVSGLQPGVAGAYLADTAARAYSGTPSVTSAGSPTNASVAGSPYAINVAQGSLAALNGYKLALASPGQLSVAAEPITISAAPNGKTYDATTAAAATPTVTTGALYDAATLSETYATPNAGTGLTLNPQIAFANPAAAGNYIVTLAPAQTGTINPAPVTITASPNTKIYDATTSAAATPTLTAGVLYDAATFSETYATPNVGTGLTLNPQIAFANPAAAGNYAVTLAAAKTGTINPEPVTITPAPNTKIYDATTSAAATPTVTAGVLYDAATFSETYAAPNAGTGLTLNAQIAFANPAAAGNYAVTLAPAQTGTITHAPVTITPSPNTKIYDSTTSAAAIPTVTAGVLYDAATFSETYATPNVGTGLTLNPQIAFANPAAAGNYAVTLAAARTGTITPAPVTITPSPNTKVYDATTSAAATPTVTAGVLYDAATFSETYAAPNAGTGLTLNPQIAFANGAAAANYAVTLAPANTGTINPQSLTVVATANTKPFDGNTSAAAMPVLTAGTLFDPATLSESYATSNPAIGIVLTPAIAFTNPRAATNYQVTLVPTGVQPPNTGIILPPSTLQISLSPSVFVNQAPEIGIFGAASTCGVAPHLPDASTLGEPGAAIQAISAAMSKYCERCRDATQEDIANALERYADALEVIIQKLPPKLRAQLIHIPAMVRAAAVRARTAPTRAAAVRVLQQTVAQVHREIALVRAEDPDSVRIRTAVGAGVTGVLNSAALALARAEGI